MRFGEKIQKTVPVWVKAYRLAQTFNNKPVHNVVCLHAFMVSTTEPCCANGQIYKLNHNVLDIELFTPNCSAVYVLWSKA